MTLVRRQGRPEVIEADVCIIGSGISAAMVAEKLVEDRQARIVVVEAGDDTVPLAERAAHRARFIAYGENPWGTDHIDGMTADGIQSRSMQVGGLAMHWGGVTPRFSPEDFRTKSMYGVGHDWPVSYEELDPFYQEAEERIGVAGEQGPAAMDPRSKPFPMPALPLTYNLEQLRKWTDASGIAMWSQPSSKNSVPYRGRAVCCRNDTCSPVCPVGAKYSPDFTWGTLRASKQVELIPRTLVRRLVVEDGSNRIVRAEAVRRDRGGSAGAPVHFRARTFVVAAGYAWSPHLLLVSRSSRFPNGLANRSGMVGKYMTGHRNVSAFIKLPVKLYPGMNEQHSLVTKQFMRPGKLDKYVRHDLRVWESSVGRRPRLKGDGGAVLLGDEMMADWRRRVTEGTARVRAYYDVIPDRESALTLNGSATNAYGDPQPKLTFRDSPESAALRGHTEDSIKALFQRMARAGNGEIIRTAVDEFQDHPAGGCRMGTDPATSVVDSHGRAHDHENLFVVGAPTSVSGGCANATLTFIAVALRQATAIGRDL
ncbi:MAG TPA: GMC family oxidoreductase [Gemmatimonadaceae bacterium]|nr:GMC family oxidoreductase [Gemmatimonadaceae bacterium]